MANLGYIQVVRHCNNRCGFCSNPETPWVHDLATMRELVDDLVGRGYYGVILTGGEPTLHPELPRIIEYAGESGLHVRMITNGSRLADPELARRLADAGLRHVHVSTYSPRPEVEERIRGVAGTLELASRAADNAHAMGMTVDANTVPNRLNADHMDEWVEWWIERHPFVRHFVWNNLDPLTGRAVANRAAYVARLGDFEASVERAMERLDSTGRTFRAEKVPLCYMTRFAWASTETRKIVKGEERVVHFLDEKQTVRQATWGHSYASACEPCSLRSICAGLYAMGEGYEAVELHPVFVPIEPIVERIITDPADPSYPHRTLAAWRRDFEQRQQAGVDPSATGRNLGPVGKRTDE